MSKEIVPEPGIEPKPSAIVKAHSWSETAVKKEASTPMLSKGASIGKNKDELFK